MKSDKTKPGKPGKTPRFLGVIEGYLPGRYTPGNPSACDIRHTAHLVMTSQEIIIDLADMVDLELNDVAEAMSYLGYVVARIDGKTGWLLGIQK